MTNQYFLISTAFYLHQSANQHFTLGLGNSTIKFMNGDLRPGREGGQR